MQVTIVRERQPYHPLLGRNVNLDSRSWAYALQPQATPIMPVRHEASIGILNQGNVGACTGNAALSCAYHLPFFSPAAPDWSYPPTQDGATAWYARNTELDGYGGTYRPDDTGSDGLTASKVAVEAGIITGYQMAGDLTSSLEALQDRPGITGLPWYRSMFEPGPGGLLYVDMSTGLSGGHEICVDEIVGADAPGNGTGEILVGGPNSWGLDWGDGGRWYLRASDWWALRQQQGDVYFWTAKSQPAPVPAPDLEPSVADLALWAATAPFRGARHIAPHIVQTAYALETWATQKGIV